jgi:hypothetical protein
MHPLYPNLVNHLEGYDSHYLFHAGDVIRYLKTGDKINGS